MKKNRMNDNNFIVKESDEDEVIEIIADLESDSLDDVVNQEKNIVKKM